LGDDCTQPYLTREDYEKSLNTQQSSIKGEKRDYIDLCSYQEETDMIMAEVEPRYNLRSRSKPISTTQPKKILKLWARMTQSREKGAQELHIFAHNQDHM
jgi:hypothetical protein